jgi:hypothetical protein
MESRPSNFHRYTSVGDEMAESQPKNNRTIGALFWALSWIAAPIFALYQSRISADQQPWVLHHPNENWGLMAIFIAAPMLCGLYWLYLFISNQD